MDGYSGSSRNFRTFWIEHLSDILETSVHTEILELNDAKTENNWRGNFNVKCSCYVYLVANNNRVLLPFRFSIKNSSVPRS